jgi:hypothetical protein
MPLVPLAPPLNHHFGLGQTLVDLRIIPSDLLSVRRRTLLEIVLLDLLQLASQAITLRDPPSLIVIHRVRISQSIQEQSLFVFERFVTLIEFHLGRTVNAQPTGCPP